MKLSIYKGCASLVVMSCLLFFSSCIDDGDETIALESGDMEEMILGSWKVSKSELYDLTTGEYDSDMPSDNLLGKVYELRRGGQGSILERGTQQYISWSLNSSSETVNIDGDSYSIASLGDKLLAIEHNRTVQGERYRNRFLLKRVGYLASEEEEDNDATQVVSSNEGRTFRRFGYTVIVPNGAVPLTTSGDNGQVAFSIQLTDELPAPLPSGTTLLQNGNVLIEPMNFIFSSPLSIKVPLQGFNAADVRVYRYNETLGRWELIPFSSINSDGTATISVIELGHFIVVKTTTSDSTSQLSIGGIHIDRSYIESGYYYYLTLVPTSGSASQRSIAFTSDGHDLYMSGIARGSYYATITRERRSSTSARASVIETQTTRITVSDYLTRGNGGYSTYTGWTELAIGNDWSTGRPSSWGTETVTYGTGKFQATLTWTNVSSSITDYDLHLTTPSGNEIYYSNKRDGSFELDRDWISALGDATENIYSIDNDIPSGNYVVRVNHFDGATGKRYNCRIIMNGRVVKSVSGILNSGYDVIYSFTIE